MKSIFFAVLILMMVGSIFSKEPTNLIYRPGNDSLVLVSTDGATPHERGTARLTCEGECLVLTAEFTDSDIGNQAVQNNEKTWETGDVCEFFFQPAGRIDYYEFHVTPNGYTLQLHIPDVTLLRKIPFEEKIFESGFKTSATVLDGRWTARMEIPLEVLGNAAFEGSRFAVCRYNYNKDRKEPELSSAPCLRDGFHAPESWYVIVSKTETER